MFEIHPAIDLLCQILGYTGVTIAIIWVIGKISGVSRNFSEANRMIEEAKYLPGGSKYIHPMEEEAEYEELSWKAHA